MGLDRKHKDVAEHKEGESLPDAIDDWADDDFGLYNRRSCLFPYSFFLALIRDFPN